MEKTLHFVAGLPRSGSTLIQCILRQNPSVHAEPVSSLAVCFNSVFANWDGIESNREYPNEEAKMNVLKGILHGYHASVDKPIVFDKDRMWVSKIALLEEVLQRPVKVLCCVRNPAEILSSFEKIRRSNPTRLTLADSAPEGSTIAGRCLYYAGPNGPMGMSHAVLKDAVTVGHLDRLLFIDYNRFCNSPKSQTKRIYDFFELPSFEHDFENIEQKEAYNDTTLMLPGLHKIKNRLEKTTVNCVEYLGLDLYDQYNRQIFWDAWI
jgi:sulfotransferase